MQALASLLIFGFILAIPACLVYSSGAGSNNVFDITGFSDLSAASAGLDGSNEEKDGTDTGTTNTDASQNIVRMGSMLLTARSASEIVSSMDFITSFCMVVFLIYVRHRLMIMEKEVHLDKDSASAYTIEISYGLPSNVTEDELKDHFSKLYDLSKTDYRNRSPMYVVDANYAKLHHEKKLAKVKKKQKKTSLHAQSKNEEALKKETNDRKEKNYDKNEMWQPHDEDPKIVSTVQDISHHADAEQFLNSWVADVVLVRDEGDILRNYIELESIDSKVRHQRALVKRVSPDTEFKKGANSVKAAKLTKKLMKYEYQQQQGLRNVQDNKEQTEIPVVRAFVTFNHEESFKRAVKDYKSAWRSRCCGSRKDLQFKGHLLHVKPALEPGKNVHFFSLQQSIVLNAYLIFFIACFLFFHTGDVVFENQGEYKKPIEARVRLVSSLCVVFSVLIVSLLSIILVHFIKASLSSSSSPGGTEKLCSVTLPAALSSHSFGSDLKYTRFVEKDNKCKQATNTMESVFLVVQGEGFPASRYNISHCAPDIHSCSVSVDNTLCPCVVTNNEIRKCPRNEQITTNEINTCYCIQRMNQLLEKESVNDALKKLLKYDGDICNSWLQKEGLTTIFSIAASVIVAVVNVVLGNIIIFMAGKARHGSLSAKDTQVFLVYSLAQLFNSLVLNVIVNAKIGNLPSIGEYDDFSRGWFAEAGTAMTSTMLILSFSSHITPLLGYMKFSRAKKLARKNADTAVSQPDLNGKFVGDPYDFPVRMAEVLIPVAAAILFGTFLPLLYIIGLLAIVLAFWVDKCLLVKYHRRPPPMSASIPLFAINILVICVIIRVGISCWIFGNETLFISEGVENDLILSATGSSLDFSRVSKRTSLPHLLLLIILLGGIFTEQVFEKTVLVVIQTIVGAIQGEKESSNVSKSHHRHAHHHALYKPPFTSIYSTPVPPLNTFSHGDARNKEATDAAATSTTSTTSTISTTPNKMSSKRNKPSQGKITHKIVDKENAMRGWVHVCKKTNFQSSCTDLYCTEWHEKRKMWMSDTTVQGIAHKKGEFARTWEVIRTNALHTYRIGYNERYVSVVHLRNEERYESQGDETKRLKQEKKVMKKEVKAMKKKLSRMNSDM